MKARMSIKSIILTMTAIYIASMFFINICLAGNTGKVSVETAKLREQPNTDCKVLELISEGEEVEILSQENDWYKIKYKKITGYVRQDLLKVDNKKEITNKENTNTNTENNTTNEVTTETNTTPENKETVTETNTVEPSTKVETNPEKPVENEIVKSGKYKVSENVKIKVIPLISSIELDELAKDTEIEVTEILNDWIKVKTSDEKTGWIRKEKITTKKEETVVNTSQIKPEQTQPNTKQPETQTEKPVETTKPAQQPKTMYINSETVNVRKEPNTSSKIVKQLTINTKVIVVSTENGWACVEINGEKAYISEKLLSSQKQETSRSSTTRRNNQTTTNTSTNTTQTQNNKEQTNTTQVATPEPAPTTSSKGNDIVSYAKQFLGCKYVYGGTTTNGFDCSGFTQYVYKNFGISLNRTAAAQYSNGTSVSDLQAGDLVMFGKSGINHVGIYIGGNTFIHAANKSRGVTTDTLASGYYKTNYVGARRIIQ